jgi:ssDNA-binding Zn-finger/Zn-ribbon topoisomerase 1
MSGSLHALQDHAQVASDSFCARYVKPSKRNRRHAGTHTHFDNTSSSPRPASGKFYRPRDHEASPFFKIVRDHFDEFEKVYPERYQERYGYWRPVIRSSIDKFLKCGDLKEGFARVRCPDCKEEFFVAFSCRQRSCCPSCDQKRSLLLALRLKDEVLAVVPHRQWVFTIPKRLRVYFRYDRKLLGKLCRAAYDTVCDVFKLEIDGDSGVPAMIGAVQTFGDLIHWHSHVHAIVPEGVFTESGHFVHIPDIWKHRAAEFWQERIFCLLLDEHKINDEIAGNMRSWKHSGFSVDNSVRITAGDQTGMQRLIEYIARCPFSLARMVSLTKDGKIIYRAAHPHCLPFPLSGDATLLAGIPRNFEVFEPLDFLAEVTQHIPNKGEHQIRYYGFYSNKSRGLQQKRHPELVEGKKPRVEQISAMPETDTPFRRKCRITWAALIMAVYEVDPLKCPKCGGTMKIVTSFLKRKVSGARHRFYCIAL